MLHSCFDTRASIRLRRKATFVTSALLTSDHLDKPMLANYFGKLAPTLVGQLSTLDDVDVRESTIRALTTFASRGLSAELMAAHGASIDMAIAAVQAKASAAPPEEGKEDDRANHAEELLLWGQFQAALGGTSNSM